MAETERHDAYWAGVESEAAERVAGLFDEGGAASLAEVLGHGRGLSSLRDAKAALAYVLRHGDACEVACAVLALGDWTHARNELAEHGASPAGAGAE